MYKSEFKKLIFIFLLGGIERFIFNGFRSILTLYMIKELLCTSSIALNSYGFIMMISYFMPLIGGWFISKKNINYNALKFGFISYSIGSLILIFLGNFFFIGTSFLLCGCGLIRPLIFPLLGEEVNKHNLSSESTFTYFYSFMNFSTLVGTATCSILGEAIAWNATFSAMFLVSIIGITISCYLKSNVNHLKHNFNIILFMLICINILYIFFSINSELQNILLVTFISLTILYFTKTVIIKDMHISNFKSYLFMLLIHITFFSIYEQSGSALVLFVEAHVNRNLPFLGLNFVPATFFQSIDPFFNILLGICVAYLWNTQRQHRHFLLPNNKMLFGLLVLASGFLVLLITSKLAGYIISPWFLCLAVFLFVLGEILTVPIGISLISKTTPKERTIFYTGFWSFSVGIAQFISGKIASLSLGGIEFLNKRESISSYVNFFILLLIITVGSIFFLILLKKCLRVKL